MPVQECHESFKDLCVPSYHMIESHLSNRNSSGDFPACQVGNLCQNAYKTGKVMPKHLLLCQNTYKTPFFRFLTYDLLSWRIISFLTICANSAISLSVNSRKESRLLLGKTPLFCSVNLINSITFFPAYQQVHAFVPGYVPKLSGNPIPEPILFSVFLQPHQRIFQQYL